MKTIQQICLEERGLIKVSGSDRFIFLQGLISNDIEKIRSEPAIWAALLTPQGKYLHDFFIAEIEDTFFIDCEADRLMDLGKRLSGYKMRADINLEISEDFGVWAAYNDKTLDVANCANHPSEMISPNSGIIYSDPRIPDMGVRAILPKNSAESVWTEAGILLGDRSQYETLRISLGLPDGSRDMIVEKSILLENNFDQLNGIDWNKGCYIGQELTARTKYRGLVKKRLLPVEVVGKSLKSGAIIKANGRDAGEVRTVMGKFGLALLRLESMRQAENGEISLNAEGVIINPRRPPWFSAEN